MTKYNKENIATIKNYVCEHICDVPVQYKEEQEIQRKICECTCNLEHLLKTLLPEEVIDMSRSKIYRMLDELIKLDDMEFIAYETKCKAKQEILKNIEAYERGWKNREYNIIKNL